MSKSYTISETYTLPSKGSALIYGEAIDPRFTIRAMTTEEEMKRLSPTDMPYKAMSDIIEDCLVEKGNYNVYDLHIADYEFLLHKLRIATYGPDYRVEVYCPNCGEITKTSINLDHLDVTVFDEEDETNFGIIELPVTKKRIELNIQTPRILDNIELRIKEIKKKSKGQAVMPELPVTLTHLIKTVDGQRMREDALDTFVRKLPMGDTTYLFHEASKFKRKVGLDATATASCGSCGYDVVTTFRITSEFFGPTLD